MAGGASAGGVMVGETDEAQVQLGPRPFYLVDDMSEGSLKTKLKSCEKGPFKRTDFSISHRGAPLQYADHTEVGYEAAIKMGAGIIECDVTVTKDNQLVCRHGDCDLAETTDILTRPELARKCTGQFKPFVPAHFDWLGFHGAVDATAKCCTTDFTLAELKTLRGKVDRGFNKSASTAQLYPMSEAAGYAQMGHVMSHADSIALFKKNGVKMIPEVKSASAFPKGLDHDGFRKLLIKAYVDAKVDPSDVFIQTFNKNDVLYLNKNEPAFAKNAALLMYGVEKKSKDDANKYMQDLYDEGIRTVAVFYPDLVSKDKDGKYSATKTLLAATKAKLDVIAWTVEYQTPSRGGDEIYNTLDVLAKNGAKGVFSNWPETVSYYASCMGLK
ncbi:glycerophosphodiester phosphodiesterase [Phyllobacterium endophyticum]|nr:glycerophosphodiester phosphodiesterase [Phyllobacterium endophyticum]